MSSSEIRPQVSVIVPTYNRCELLERTLNHLVSQRMPVGEFEVIVSDDGSSDATEAVTRSFGDRLRMKYVFQEDLGFRAGMARNAGARLAAAPVLVFLDTGSMVGPDFLRQHLSEHGRDTEHVAVVGYAYGWAGAPEPMSGIDAALQQFPPDEVVARFRDHPGFQDARHQTLLEYGFELSNHLVPWPMLLSLNFSVRAEDFWAAGGFDEEFCGWGFEDIELGYRFFCHRVSLKLSREAWVVEWPHDRDLDAMMRDATVNMAKFLRKHPEPSVEILWWALNKANMWFCETYYRELSAWRNRTRSLDITAELSAAAQDIQPGDRVAVIGSGGNIPASLAGATVLDFDRDLLDQAVAAGYSSAHHAIGLRTPLADQSVDTVLITSRMTGMERRWGDDIMAEGQRIGRQVRALWQVSR